MPAAPWTDELMNRMRGVGDSLADDAIAETYALGKEDMVRRALLEFDGNDEPIPADLPVHLQRYFEVTSVLPDWPMRR